ncbi:hypothetical protein [Streptomyces globosus]|uniref:hypothetical protein n=1 Tax=Streptomyces globosus TaxID=68209 RepID=UPI0031D10A29
MTWDYAELAKEASKRGGPVALRYFYRGQGAIIGAALTGAGMAGTRLYDKWRARRTAAAEPAPQTTETPTPGESTPQH